MDVRVISLQKGYELVTQELRRQIEQGMLQPGQKLPSVVALASSFGVGRSTIREALSALKAMGLLDIRQGGGTYVKAKLPDASSDDDTWIIRSESLKEILEVRKVLETGCAALAALNRDDGDLEQLARILSQMEESLQDEALSEKTDVHFHLLIAQASKNPLLFQLMESVSSKLHDTIKDTRRLWFFQEEATAHRLLKEHREIYAAIVERNESRTADLMRNHLSRVENVLHHALGQRK